jgi:hypothetical protein
VSTAETTEGSNAKTHGKYLTKRTENFPAAFTILKQL